MAILHVAGLGQPVLRTEASPVDPGEIQTPAFQAFLDDLLQSMQFHEGVGLAAPQVFSPRRVVAVEVPGDLDDEGDGVDPTVFINPELTVIDETPVLGWEGCLSLKDLRGIVPRHNKILLRALDRSGDEVERPYAGFTARVLQHEVDHLDGVVFVDRMPDLSSLSFSRELELVARARAAEAADTE